MYVFFILFLLPSPNFCVSRFRFSILLFIYPRTHLTTFDIFSVFPWRSVYEYTMILFFFFLTDRASDAAQPCMQLSTWILTITPPLYRKQYLIRVSSVTTSWSVYSYSSFRTHRNVDYSTAINMIPASRTSRAPFHLVRVSFRL